MPNQHKNNVITITETAKDGSKVKLTRLTGDALVTANLNIVWKEWIKEQPSRKTGLLYFSEALDISKSYLYDMLCGKNRVSEKCVDAVCEKLGYSQTWMRTGTLPKKAIAEPVFHMRDVKDVEIELVKVKQGYARYEARQTGIENELEDQRNEINELKNLIAELSKKINL